MAAQTGMSAEAVLSGECWVMSPSGDSLMFQRVRNGRVIESYCPVEASKAVVFAVAITQGLEPPRYLCLMSD